MSDLQNQTPADTYKGLLQVGDYTNGVDGNSEYIEDGEGTPSALSISTSKVGVGTVSPSAELDVNGNVVADEYALDQTGSSSSAVAIHAPATNELAIRTNSTEAMRIDSNGQVGIGTENMGELLTVREVNPNSNVISRFQDEGNDDSSVATGDGVVKVVRINSLPSGYSDGGKPITYLDLAIDADNNAVGFGMGNGSSSLPAGDADLSNCEIVLKQGQVGIGTVSPSTKLDVDGDATVSGDMKVGGLLYNESISSTFQQNQTISVTAPSISEGSVYHVSATRHTGSSSSQLRVAYVHYTNNGTAVLSDSISNSNVNLTASGSTISVTNNSTSATLKLRVLRVG